MRTFVYIDGFNLYYRALRKTPYKWLNLYIFAKSLLSEDDEISRIRYFTARVSARTNAEAPKRQQTYLNALATIPMLKVHYGRFLSKKIVRPLVDDPSRYVEVHDTEEKGSDVNLASYLLHDAHRRRFDAALIVSQDSDLCEPIRMVTNDLGLVIGQAWLDGKRQSDCFKRITSFVRHSTASRLAAAQFPDSLMGRNGRLIHKPSGW